MALPNDSATLPAAATVVATQLVSAKEYQAVVLADEGGHLQGTRDCYRLIVPSQAVGASKVYVDLFNATGSGTTLQIVQARCYVNMDTAVTGVLGVQLHLTRTTAVGTGGTAATLEGATLTATNIGKLNPASPALNANITARLAPAGGATAGAVIGYTNVFTEETSAGAALASAVGASLLPFAGYDVRVPENSGIRIVQGTVASVGNLVFVIDFVTL